MNPVAGPRELGVMVKTVRECRGMLQAVRNACDQTLLLDERDFLNRAIESLNQAHDRLRARVGHLPTAPLTRAVGVRPPPSRPAPQNVLINEATQRVVRKDGSP